MSKNPLSSDRCPTGVLAHAPSSDVGPAPTSPATSASSWGRRAGGPRRPTSVGVGGVLAAAVVAGAAFAGSPPNDDCSTPTFISGGGMFNFDLTNATTGVEGQAADNCIGNDGTTIIDQDVWFCWTADCTGLVTISTCGFTQQNTKIALWAGCGCPDDATLPLCCNDDFCDLQSTILCEVVCGQQYMIQIGKSPDGLPGLPGMFRIECEGEPCPSEPCFVVPGSCCAGAPSYDTPDFAGFTGQVGVGTASPDIVGGSVVTVFDFDDFSSAPIDAPWGTTRYSDPSWTGANLGSIFGVCLDPAGNIYVTASTTYYTDLVGSGGAGAVYRLDSVTGAISTFASLPNSGPGLGNIAYDCDFDQFFVTNFDDGLIYRLDNAGNVLSTFDHGIPDDPTVSYAPLGDRPWGITVHAGRVWYGLWVEDGGRPTGGADNEVWSIALDGSGDFSGTEQLEVSVPPRVGFVWSSPVSDIRFTPAGTMQVAERGMGTDSTPDYPHQARLLEFSCENGVWFPGPATFGVGAFGSNENSSGGLDVDYGPEARTWVSGNALHFGGVYPDYIYGFTGIPTTGGNVTTSLLVDYNGVINDFGADKTDIGDIELSCPRDACLEYEASAECEIGPAGWTGNYLITVTLTNISGTDAQYVLLPGDDTDPNVIELNPVLPGDGSSSQTIQLTVSGQDPGDYCFDLLLADAEVNVCCEEEICVELPDCFCMLFADVSVVCDADGNLVLNFGFVNTTPDVVEHMFLLPLPVGGPETITPDYVDLPSIAPGGGANVGPFVITGATPGTELCIRVTLHDENLLECCSRDLCFTVPDCGPGATGDVNGDGVIDFTDLIVLLSAWGTSGPGDLNGDGTVNFLDLLILLAAL